MSKNMKPIIGIVPRVMTHSNNYKVQVNENYFTPFNKRDVNVFVLPLDNPNVLELLDLCDGFLLPGGDDIDPTCYGQTNDEGLSKDIDPALDKIDKIVLDYAVKTKKPVLGICRGVQSIAAFLGGSLHQDIEHAGLKHESVDHKHMVKTMPNTRVTHLFPSEFLSNSYHHQVVDKVPAGFVVTHTHLDVIEGLVHTELPIFGLQWHPERMDTPETETIFDWFIELVKNNK
ncbi:MAG: gamma-glutamyl-gamma-aminobutyrate hydrolase family protein [Bacilli bacterium]|nr:gamma-glutamyl-gamma-aminobutyrate hydrolase family protein [Bacilli bacterium]